MLPELKVWNIDYSFIISNYLDRELWKMKWNLFVYKNNVFTLNLHSIDTKNNKICFEIRYNKQNWINQTIYYDIDNTSINILKQQINGAIFRLMEEEDKDLCSDTDGYYYIKKLYNNEDDKLREIAEEYLDENGITLDDVREAYIEKYIDDNRKVDKYLNEYLLSHKYRYLTELMIIFTKITNDTARYNEIKSAIQDDNRIKEIEDKLKEFEEYFNSEEYKEDMVDELEGI